MTNLIFTHANKIKGAWQKAVSSIVETGQLLIKAKEDLEHGEFGKMFEIGKLPFSKDVAQHLMRIARHPVLSKAAYTQLLPPSWMTLFILSRVPEKKLLGWIEDGTITTATEQREAEALVASKSKKLPTPKLDKARDIVRSIISDDKPTNSRKLQNEHGISHVHFETAIAVERAIKNERPVDVSTLSLNAQQKIDLAIKQITRKLEYEIEKRVREENLSFLKSQLDQYNENAKHYELVINRRGGIMTRAEYRSILSCLHPDRIPDVDLKRRYEHAFNLFTKLEKVVLNEKESPTNPSNVPKTVDELLKRKAEYHQTKKSKHRSVIIR